MTWRFSISQRFFIATVIISCLAVGTVSFFYDREAEAAIVQRSFDQLASVRTLKESNVHDYFRSLEIMLSMLASHPETIHTFARELRLRYDIQDMLILSPNGKILYTHRYPELTGKPVQDSIWNLVQKTALPSDTSNVEFTDVVRFQGEMSSFAVARIAPSFQGGARQYSGSIIVAHISSRALNRIMTERAGTSETGESYIVGEDSLMRTDSRFIAPSTILRLAVQTAPVRMALAERTGLLETEDYRQMPVLSAFAPLTIGKLRWAIITEMDVQEITIPIQATRRRIIVLGLAISLFVAGIAWYGARAVSKPIVLLQGHLSAIAQGNLPDEPLQNKRRDEIGAMTEELNMMTDSLRNATVFAREIGAGRFDAECTPRSPQDTLVIALNDMKHELQRLLADEQSRAMQRTLALVEGEERERTRIARDVHDGIGQTLTALRFNLARVADEHVRSELFDLLDDAIAEVRAISHNLMPSVLIDFGLEAALEQLCSKTAEAAHIPIQRMIAPLATRLDSPREIAVYRITQEALSNALRYAHATAISLRFGMNPEHSALQMEIRDNGVGFDMASIERGNGLSNMRERAALFAGEVSIGTEPGKGTHIVLSIPLSQDQYL